MIKVTVWNEYLEELQYEHVAKVYPNGIHECIREFLEKDPEIQVVYPDGWRTRDCRMKF